MSYVLGDDEDAIGGSEELPDNLDLIGADVGEGSEDDLLVGAKHLIKTLNSLLLLRSAFRTTSHQFNYYSIN